jgi:hypothetical protein
MSGSGWWERGTLGQRFGKLFVLYLAVFVVIFSCLRLLGLVIHWNWLAGPAFVSGRFWLKCVTFAFVFAVAMNLAGRRGRSC